jgi:hypothetical protein
MRPSQVRRLLLRRFLFLLIRFVAVFFFVVAATAAAITLACLAAADNCADGGATGGAIGIGAPRGLNAKKKKQNVSYDRRDKEYSETKLSTTRQKYLSREVPIPKGCPKNR